MTVTCIILVTCIIIGMLMVLKINKHTTETMKRVTLEFKEEINNRN